MQGPAIHYNVGVAAYRAGDWGRAQSAFHEVARTPAMAALAHYNLGLVALKRADSRAARRWFELASREAADERLAALVAERLGDLAVPAPAAWSAYARAGVGYDDNVALRADSVDTPGTGTGDEFADALVAGSYSFRRDWRVDGAAQALRHSSLDAFDQTAVSLGLAHAVELYSWRSEFGVHASRLALGGEVFERSAGVSAQVTRSITPRDRLRVQVRVTSVDGEGDFSALSGARYELRARYDWSWRSWSFGTHARVELNDGDDEAFASRWSELGAEARWTLSPAWTLAASPAYRRTHYPGASTVAARDDGRITLRLEAARSLWPQAQLTLRYELEHNRSDADGREYDRNWLGAFFEIWR